MPVDQFDKESSLSYPQISKKGYDHKNEQYKLYMYSEFGFPMPSDVHRDLKDSMPVLFVPGNAGSYQQVRSLASTCIRRQLQSLEAFKFVFYTIDFGGQLSGLDGGLIKSQIIYVHRCLNQISRMHPSDTNGVILIGHSVGGFISKALLTVPSFDFNSVPLLISLASPLTSPYLIFDDQMRELYDRTNRIWADEKTHNNTITLSISGGITDHLVPMHSSMDPQYDLSLTTSSIKDVWLATDHVCITWCRELMHKLAQLLSALMDKKQTRLIDNKGSALSIIKNVLLDQVNYVKDNSNVIYKDWKTVRSHVLESFHEFYSASRLQLTNNIIVLNITDHNAKDILIFVHHIDTLKETGIFGCSNVNTSSNQLNCVKRVELMHLMVSIPSRRFEPKKKALRVDVRSINYIALDFNDRALQPLSKTGNKVPESLTVQELDESPEQVLYIPPLFEFVFRKLFYIDSYKHKITHKNLPFVHIKIMLLNLKYKTQIYSLRYESVKCKPSTRNRNTPTLMITQDGYLSESFHSSTIGKDLSAVVVKLRSQRSVKIKETDSNGTEHTQHAYLELFIDGDCENYIQIQVDVLDLIVACIQNSLGRILSSTTYLAYLYLVSSTFKYRAHQQVSGGLQPFDFGLKFLGYILVSLRPENLSPASEISLSGGEEICDKILTSLLIFVLSTGVLAYLGYLVNRVIDVANILNNAQSLIRCKLLKLDIFNNKSPSDTQNDPDMETVNDKNMKIIGADLDWLLMVLTIAGSVVFSTALMTLFTLLMLVKLELSLSSIRSRRSELQAGIHPTGKDVPPSKQFASSENLNPSYRSTQIHDLIVDIAVLGVLSLIANIPAALIQLNSKRINSPAVMFEKTHKDMSFLASTISLLMVKLICERICSDYAHHMDSSNQVDKHHRCSEGRLSRIVSALPIGYLHLATLGPILLIEMNMNNINLALVTSLLWVNGFMHKQNKQRVRPSGTIK